MKKLLLSAIFGVAFLAACNTSPTPTQKALGVLEVSINTDGVSTARLESTLSGQSVTYRESDVVFGTGTTQVVSPTGSAYTYLVASFPVSHTGSSTLPFNNLTLYAIAKSGNVGDTAIKSISNFGGVTDLTEQARLAKLVIPVTPVQTSGTGIAISADADFQAFTIGEVSNATIATGIGFNDKILNYGFAARCLTTCTNNSRQIPTNGTGQIKIAVRVPKSSGTYGFIMNFVVLNETDSRVTRSVFPPESVADAQTRGLSVTATRLMQFGLNRTQTSQTLGNDFVDDVFTSRQNASIQALGIGRIDAGDAHSCGLNAIGKAYCWGRGADGQLGNNGSTDSSIPVAVVAVTGLATNTLNFSSISTGDAHPCGITTAGKAYCWGNGGNGRLGSNFPSDPNLPIPTTVVGTNGTTTNTLDFSSISAGDAHTCGITTAGKAYCWGYGGTGQLGNNDPNNAASKIPVAVVGTDGTTISPLDFSSISAGGSHTCGITTASKAYCWGYGFNGRLGNNDPNNAASKTPVAVVGTDGTTTNTLDFSSIGAGASHTCGITTAGKAYCWGDSFTGQLGNNDPNNSDSKIPVAVVGTNGTTTSPLDFSSISAGSRHNCGITTDGKAYCWGGGFFGRLGNNNTANSNIPVAVTATDYKL